MNSVRGPSWGCVEWVKHEVHSTDSKKNPVMETILEHVEEWHGVIRKPVNKESLELPLHVMNKDHGKPYLLTEVILEGLAIDLLLEHNKKCGNQHWPKILDQEHQLPRDL